MGIQTSLWMGCPIRNLKVHSLYAAPLERFAGLRVLHRSDAPRHPPRTLARLWLLFQAAHVSRASCSLASISSLFALGTIKVSICYSIVQCTPFLVLRYYAILWDGCQYYFPGIFGVREKLPQERGIEQEK